jgi:hypothetical protein
VTRDAIADRLVNYSDAIVAFAVVNSLAFLIALTERDVRCSFGDIQPTFWVSYLLFFSLLTGALVGCRHAELRLRRGSSDEDQDAARALKYFHVARIGIIWATAFACMQLVRMAFADTCGPPAP